MPQIRAKTTNIERHRVLLVLKAAGFADAQLGDNFDLQDGSSATSPLALCNCQCKTRAQKGFNK
jgi:hypothetical protein